MPTQAIIDRIRKCIALAASPNPAEAAAATEMASKLKKIHGLQDAQIEPEKVTDCQFSPTDKVDKALMLQLAASIVRAQFAEVAQEAVA